MIKVRVFCPPLRALLLLPFAAATVIAGPPFDTDDPEPVHYLHWEFYLASEQHFFRSTSDATLPHVEINFGVLPNVQLHFVAPMGYAHSIDRTNYGYSDTEVGVKFRFVQETDDMPQIGTFPLVEIPTGDRSRDLGNGKLQVYLPVWFQKSWGDFTTYGGGGYWYNPGEGQKNWMFLGWELQYNFSEVVTLGGEVFYRTADSQDSRSDTAFKLGGYININEHHHILIALGHSVAGSGLTTGYLGYQFTI